MKAIKLVAITLLSGFLAFAVSGCDSTGTNADVGQGKVQIQMKTLSGSSSKANSFNVNSSHDSLVVEGSNGTLKIDDIRFIAEEFSLEKEEENGGDDSDSDNEEIEAGPFFVDLPLVSDTLFIGENLIPEGTYSELEMEVGDLDFEDEDSDESYPELADSIRSEFPDWPEDASMVVTGTFTDSDGNSNSFKVFAEAEIEIEKEFDSPIEVTADNINEVISINIMPESWFMKEDGTVYDLSQADWDKTNEVLEFEGEFENGIKNVDSDREQDDGDDSDNESDD